MLDAANAVAQNNSQHMEWVAAGAPSSLDDASAHQAVLDASTHEPQATAESPVTDGPTAAPTTPAAAALLALPPLPPLSQLPPMPVGQEPACELAAYPGAEMDGVQSEPATPSAHCGVLAEMEQQKMRFRSIDAGMTALVEQATATPGPRYISVQESISKTLRQRGPSLFLTKQPVLKYPLYPRSLALAAASAAVVTSREADHLGAGLAAGSLEAHMQLHAQAREQQLEEAYQRNRWKPARRSTVMRRVNAVALSLPSPWSNAGAAGGTHEEEQPRGRARQSTPVWERLTRTPTTSNSGAAATQPPPSRGGANSVSAPPAPAASPCSKGSQQPGTQRLQQLVRGKERSTTSVKPSAAPRGGKAGGRQLQTRLPSLKPQQKLPAQVAVSAAAPSTPPQQQEVKPPSLLADAAAGAMADSMMPSTHTAAWEAHAGAPRSWRGTELVTPLAGGVTHHHHHEGASFSGVGGGRRVSRVHEVVQQGHMPTAGSAARISLILNVYQGGGR
ncbi:hypothetical protein CHLRE_12g493100v5 [Chlamydomonas reinhardtii]|uniref:Uncharacterized protein n=1 Tax=Chlamydomonas reinhardtii TaxID=3055 RepID=A0A2K3D1W9_CHLRE|nr:uncharacterized protein CHLRE_12g493100v5 [Chlamydomonas reinhardtii]PNW74515.1 hypothetical protein CHLRE_12g493100v5 [Chlamydomonas reinhardtii]